VVFLIAAVIAMVVVMSIDYETLEASDRGSSTASRS
jgi:hypothetical protein